MTHRTACMVPAPRWIFDERPESYPTLGADYYEVKLPLGAVAAVYAHQPFTPEPIVRLDRGASIDMSQDDVAEIGYPESSGARHDR